MMRLLFLLFSFALLSSELECPNFSIQTKEGEEACLFPRAVLPSARPCKKAVHSIGSVSFLFWQGKIWGLEFANKSFLPNIVGSALETYEEKLFVPDFAWRPGVKLRIGRYLPHDDWDVIFGYSYYHEEFTSLKKHFNSQIVPDGLGVIPLWHYPFLQIVGGGSQNPLRFGNAAANWRMDFHSMDFELGRLFFPEFSIPLRFTIGLKGAYIHQFYHADYGNGVTVLAIDPVSHLTSQFQFLSSRFQAKTHQWGIGPRITLDSKWKIYGGLNLIGDAGFSILGSSFRIISKYRDVILPTPNQAQMKMKEHFHELTPVCEAKLGLDWGMCFSTVFLNVQIGYEYQYWWSINHARRSYVQTAPGTTTDSNGDLQMQGLNAAIQLEF